MILAAGVAGCGSFLSENSLILTAKEDTQTASTFGDGPEKIWLEKAKESYRRGQFGLAERWYRRAVEERHTNVEAWLGLAASYDRLKRFDEADKAYKTVAKMTGTTPALLNNLGYHHMLKGEFQQAEEVLLQAQEMDPGNTVVKKNLELLSAWKAKAGYPT